MAYVEENLIKSQSTSFNKKEDQLNEKKLESCSIIEAEEINDVEEVSISASSELTAKTGNNNKCTKIFMSIGVLI